MIQRKVILTTGALIVVQLLACTQINTIFSRASAELAVPTVKSHAIMTPNNATMTIHTTNSIQGSNFNVLKQEEPVIRKAILSNVDNAIFLSKSSTKSAIPVNVNAKIINHLTNSRVDTTQGVDMIKKLIAIELTDALDTIAPNSISHRIVVDNQAICNGIASTKASCSFTINVRS
jgi:hypothetical protein